MRSGCGAGGLAHRAVVISDLRRLDRSPRRSRAPSSVAQPPQGIDRNGAELLSERQGLLSRVQHIAGDESVAYPVFEVPQTRQILAAHRRTGLDFDRYHPPIRRLDNCVDLRLVVTWTLRLWALGRSVVTSSASTDLATPFLSGPRRLRAGRRRPRSPGLWCPARCRRRPWRGPVGRTRPAPASARHPTASLVSGSAGSG